MKTHFEKKKQINTNKYKYNGTVKYSFWTSQPFLYMFTRSNPSWNNNNMQTTKHVYKDTRNMSEKLIIKLTVRGFK